MDYGEEARVQESLRELREKVTEALDAVERLLELGD